MLGKWAFKKISCMNYASFMMHWILKFDVKILLNVVNTYINKINTDMLQTEYYKKVHFIV